MVTLTNVGTAYDQISAAKGLGFGIVDMAGVTSLRVRLHVSKVGSGTQTWQVWNETDGAEIGRFDDAGAAGDKVLESTFAISGLSGEKVVRIRCKSTNGADDPIYYAGAFLAK